MTELHVCRGGGQAQQESEEEDEDQEAREKELQRIHAELQKADDRCLHSSINRAFVNTPPREVCGTLGSH